MKGIKVKAYAFFFCLIFILLIGTLGFKTKDECNQLERECNDGNQCDQLALCYHEVGVTYAFFEGEENDQIAIESCQNIANIGASSGKTKYGNQANVCYTDIARIIGMRDSSKGEMICDMMGQDDRISKTFTGADTTIKLCKERVDKVATIQDQKCTLLYVMPMLLLLFITVSIHDL